MRRDKRNNIREKRSQLQELTKIRAYCDQHLNPWLQIYDQLLENQVQPTILYLAANLESDPALFLKAVEEQLNAHQKHLLERVITEDKLPVHQQLEEEYPSQQMLRYMPVNGEGELIYEEHPHSALQQAIRELGIENQHCMVFYPVYTPVMEMTLNEVLSTSAIIFEPMTDVCVVAKDFSWLIFRSLESDWAWLKK